MPMEKIILSIFGKKKFLNLANAFVEHHIFVTLDIIINKSMGHLKITFSNTNVKNVVNTMLSSLKKIQQININYKNKKIRPQTN